MPEPTQNPTTARLWRRARVRRLCVRSLIQPAGRVSEVTAVPPCPSGLNCSGSQTTLSRYNGHNQRYLRETPAGQTVFTYAPDGYSVLAEVQHTLIGATTVSNTLENVYLPTASGPMPVVALINGAPFAVYADHLNTPRRLTDAQGRPRWQWAFSGFGEQAALSIPAAGQPATGYSLRYPGQVDDGNGLFYNFNRFYDPVAGRYTQADPIGLDGGWNRFGYVGGNALGAVDPLGLNPLLGAGGAGGGAAGGALGGGALGGLGGNSTTRPIDPTDPYGPRFTPVPKWPTLPSWNTQKRDSPELEICKKEADDALERAYGYCKALGATYNDYRTRKACEETAFRKYVERLQECERQCK